MSSFATLAAGLTPAYEDLALGLAAELGCAEGDARARLTALARDLPVPGASEPRVELQGLRKVVNALAPCRRGSLLLPEALAGGGHPAAVAVAAAAVATRAGIAIEPIGDARGRLYLAHRALDEPLVIDPRAPGALLDARTLQTDLHWRCAHETALCLLDRVRERAADSGDLSTALAASALRLALPLEDHAHDERAADHAGLVARLN